MIEIILERFQCENCILLPWPVHIQYVRIELECYIKKTNKRKVTVQTKQTHPKKKWHKI